jgi:Domain of unknown function (DUF4112)
MAALRAMQRALDEAFRVPGTRIRFGWDAIVGLIPWAGDLVTAAMAGAIITHAHRVRVPKVVQARMLLNVAIDLLVGLVPFAGDVADVFWKSNTKNMALLERHAGRGSPASAGDWVFVTGIIGTIVVLAALPLIVIAWAFNQLLG